MRTSFLALIIIFNLGCSSKDQTTNTTIPNTDDTEILDENSGINIGYAPIINSVVLNQIENNSFSLTANISDDKDSINDLTILWSVESGDVIFETSKIENLNSIATFSNYIGSAILNLKITDSNGQMTEINYQIEAPTISTDDNEEDNSMSETETALNLINSYRESCGLNTLSQNSNLTDSAQNHAKYLAKNNLTGHYQNESDDYFTGVDVGARVIEAGYLTQNVSENVSTGANSIQSVNGLMSAIYHRIGFLSFDINEIGIGIDAYSETKNSYVYNMGNSKINQLCNGESFEGYGEYIFGLCKDSEFKIEKSVYEEQENYLQKNNSEIVTYPYGGQTDFLPTFDDNENPDPTPHLAVSGNPISVQFNPYFYEDGSIEIYDFELKNKDTDEVLETWTLNKSSDVNSKFSGLEFAFFPLKRLDWNTNYKATIKYSTADNNIFSKVVLFKTASLDYEILKVDVNSLTQTIKSNKDYAVVVSQDLVDNIQNGASYSCGDFEFIDTHTFRVKIQNSCYVSFNNTNVKIEFEVK